MITSLAGTAVVNDGPPSPAELEIDHLFETVYSDTATTFDPGWTHIDRSGHFHAYGRKGGLPTLTATVRHVPCDGIHAFPVEECDGYDVTDYTCRICRAAVEPGRVRQESAVIPTGVTWVVQIQDHLAPMPLGMEVTVRFWCEAVAYFGTAVVGDWRSTYSRNALRTITTLCGLGELGACAPDIVRTPMV